MQHLAVFCAVQTGTAEEIAKYSKRTVKVTAQHNEECQRLLTLMGVPIVKVKMVHDTANHASVSENGGNSIVREVMKASA